MDKRVLFSLALLGLGGISASQAATTTAVFLRMSATQWAGVTVDPLTGVAYERQGYGPTAPGAVDTPQLLAYSSAHDFEQGNQAFTATTATTLFGTYLAALDGSIYGRTSSQGSYPGDAQFSKFSATTGAVQATINMSLMSGENGADTFDWGGFSGVNAIPTASSLFVFGGDEPTNLWRLTSVDADLNQLDSFAFALGSHPGFAFAIGNYVFFNDGYRSGKITSRLDTITRQIVPVDYTITLALGVPYWDNAFYDSGSDALYLHNTATWSFYKVSDASDFFEVRSVPEPSSVLLLAAGLAVLAPWARRRHPGSAGR